MRRSSALMSVAALALMATNAFAQAKTSFAGTWTMVQDPNAMAGGGGGGGGGGRGGRGGGGGGACGGMTFTITQDDKSITCSRTQGQNEVKASYTLDGADSKNMQAGRGGTSTEVISKAKWDGANVAISTTRDFNGTSMTTTQTLSVDATGNLWIETTRPGQDGAPMSTKVQYKKS
jgi:hypothetical protein